ncbi:MAG: thioredoxin family protein [Chitinophagales bacterium]
MQFQAGDLNTALDLAEYWQKPIFIFLHTNYDEDSKNMQQSIFQQTKVVDYFNDNFVNLKLNLNSSNKEGIRLFQKHEFTRPPAYLFLSPEGEVIIKETGFKDARTFFNIGKDCLQEYQKTLGEFNFVSVEPDTKRLNISDAQQEWIDMKYQYKNGNNHPLFLYKYAYVLKNFQEEYDHVVDQYILSNAFRPLSLPENRQFVLDFTRNIECGLYTVLRDNQPLFDAYGEGHLADSVLRKAIRYSTVEAGISKNNGQFQRILSEVKQAKLPDEAMLFDKTMITYHAYAQNWDNFYRLMREEIDQQRWQNTDLIDFATRLLAFKLQRTNDLATITKWAEKISMKSPNNLNYKLTYIICLYHSQKDGKALKEAEKMVQTLKKQERNDYEPFFRIEQAIRHKEPTSQKYEYSMQLLEQIGR